jgi:hypothetical protein
MKRSFDDNRDHEREGENLVGADQGCDPAGDEEDVFRQAWALDLSGRRAAGFSFHSVRSGDFGSSASKS